MTGVRRYELDLMRFAAAAMVVAFHYAFFLPHVMGEANLAFPEVDGVARYGYLGVELFFLISGFVIVLSARRAAASGFAAARIGRLMPAYWTAATITAAALALFGGRPPEIGVGDWLVNLTLLQNVVGAPHVDPVYWTLIVEAKFYALVTILLMVAPKRRLEAALYGWLVLSAALSFAPSFDNAAYLLALRALGFVFEPQWAPYFVAGAAFGLAGAEGWSALRAVAVAAAFALALRSSLGLTAEYVEIYDIALAPTVVTGVVAGFFALMAAVSLGWLSWLAWPGFLALGALTYPLYLTHQRLGAIWFDAAADAVPRHALVSAAIVGALVLAWLIHRVVERRVGPPLRRAAERLFDHMADRARRRAA